MTATPEVQKAAILVWVEAFIEICHRLHNRDEKAAIELKTLAFLCKDVPHYRVMGVAANAARKQCYRMRSTRPDSEWNCIGDDLHELAHISGWVDSEKTTEYSCKWVEEQALKLM